MRFWKITDQQTFENALEFKNKCNKLQKDNEKKLKHIVPFNWITFYGYDKGNGFNLLVDYEGFVPKDKNLEIPIGWKRLKCNEEVLVPDLKTKKGKEVKNQLSELEKVYFKEIFKVLDIKQEDLNRFTIPYLYLSQDKKEIYLKTDDFQKVPKTRFEEVTLSYVETKL